MTEPKFTPGPWTSSLMDYHSEDPTVLVISGSDNNYICEIPNGDIEDADLALILAVPDMYEALKCACDQYCIGYAGDSIVKCEDCIIGNALRKARGETEPVSNPYKLPHTCETCQHGIWNKDGCYCNRVPSKMHKVCETGTCEHWALNQYIETNSEEIN